MSVIQRWRPLQVFLRAPTPQAGLEALAAALAAWAQWCEQHAGRACELALSGHGLISCAAPQAQALTQWDHYLGLSAATLAQSWVLRSVQVPGGDLSCAAPRALIDGLHKVARAHQVKLHWVGPWWARHAQRWLATAGAAQTLQAREPGLVTYLQTSPNEQGKPALSQVWTEASDALGVAAPTAPVVPGVTEILAQVPVDAIVSEWSPVGAFAWQTTWADGLDFVGPRVRTALWSWALLVGGLAACMAVSEQAQQFITHRDEAQAMLHRLERAQHQQTMARAAPRAASSPGQAVAQPLDDATLRQAVRVAQQLAYPWPAVIERVEQSAQQEHAVLTGFSLDISSLGGKGETRPQVRLQAALHDDASALRWVAAHGDQAQMLGRDALSTPFDTAQGHYALRAEAVWPAQEQP
ncbi:MAG: hypothetical protein V4532_03505 [Pseudomonadota bacterium]